MIYTYGSHQFADLYLASDEKPDHTQSLENIKILQSLVDKYRSLTGDKGKIEANSYWSLREGVADRVQLTFCDGSKFSVLIDGWEVETPSHKGGDL